MRPSDAPGSLTGRLADARLSGLDWTRALQDSPALVALFEKGDGRLLSINAAGRKWLMPGDELDALAVTLTDLVGVDSIELLNREISLQLKLFGRWSGTITLRDSWGGEMPAEATLMELASPQPDEPRVICLQAVRQMAGRGTRRSDEGVSDRELLHALLESLPDAVYFKDQHSRFLRVGKAMAHKICGADPAAMIGHTDFDYFTAEHARPAYEGEQEIMRTGRPIVDLEEKETWPDGHSTWVSTTKVPLHDDDGRIVGTCGVSRDITAHKESERQQRALEAQLQLAQKLESIGRLAAGIAHEINTPSQFITDNTHFLISSFAQLLGVVSAQRELVTAVAAGSDTRAALQRVQEAQAQAELDYVVAEIPRTLEQTLDGLGRVARIVRSLKEFSHPNNAQRTAADLNRAIENATVVTRHEWKYVAELEMDFAPDLPAVPCVIDEFNQVMLNLIVNAAHAIGSVAKEERAARPGRIVIRTRREGEWIRIDVQDSGTGIPAEIRHRIFEPFFTTKAMGKGTGQGLALVHSVIVKHHHGSVDFTTETGVGTTFHLRIPLVPPAQE